MSCQNFSKFCSQTATVAWMQAAFQIFIGFLHVFTYSICIDYSAVPCTRKNVLWHAFLRSGIILPLWREKWLFYFWGQTCMPYEICSKPIFLPLIYCPKFEMKFSRLSMHFCIFFIHLCVSSTQRVFVGNAWSRIFNLMSFFTKICFIL